MDISEKQAVWREQKPLFEAEFIHSHLLPFFNFNENTGDYEIKSECVNNTDDEDRKVAYETLNTGWVMWLRAKRDVKTQAVPDSPTEKTWDEIHLDPKERLYWSLRSTKKRKSDLNWSHASHQTCVGSTHGRKICEYLGVDPDGKDFVRTQEPAND